MELLVDVLIVVLKAALAMGALLHLAATVTWFERKGSALIQNRIGANRAAIFGTALFGVFNTLVADPVKALFKEDWVPRGTSQFMHSLAPFMGVFPVILSFAVVPFGPPIRVTDGVVSYLGLPDFMAGKEIALQVANLNVGILYVFAMGSLAVYGTVLAGWVSHNKFSLFGSLRASAQMVSYEITLGISIIGLIAGFQTLDLNEIVNQQTGTVVFGLLPAWGIFLSPFNIIAFLIFFVSAMAETKRAPFDLPESESELVAGYFTEYSGMKFLLFWLGEFAEIVVASTLVVVLFFGGWQLPYLNIDQVVSWLAPIIATGVLWLYSLFAEAGTGTGLIELLTMILGPVIGATCFGIKVCLFCMLQVIIRWTVPRFRYDQLLNLCWKIMLPIALFNLVASIAWIIWRG